MFKNNLKSLSIAFIMFSVLFSFGCKKEKSAGTIQIEPTEMAQEGDSSLPLKVRKFDDAKNLTFMERQSQFFWGTVTTILNR